MAPKLEPVTIDGKRGTIAYFDRNGQMTTAKQAVSAKVVFDDGTRLFLSAARGAQSPHPDQR